MELSLRKMKTIVQWTVSSSEKTSIVYSKPFRMDEQEWKLKIHPNEDALVLLLIPVSPSKENIDFCYTFFITSYNQDNADAIVRQRINDHTSGYGTGDLIYLSDITAGNFTLGVIAPTPTELFQNEILDLLYPCDRYEQTSSTSAMTLMVYSSNSLGDHQFQDPTNPTYFAPAFNQEAFHDVEFTFQASGSAEEENVDSSQQRIFGHRNILSVRCPFFFRMFTSGMRESKELEIPVTDVDYDTFYRMVRYLYTGTLSFKSLKKDDRFVFFNDSEMKQDEVVQLYKAMHQYLLFDDNPDLEDFCLQQYASTLSPATFVYRLNEDVVYDKLKDKLTEYFKTERETLGNCSAFKFHVQQISNHPITSLLLDTL